MYLFEEAYQVWQEKSLTQEEMESLLGVSDKVMSKILDTKKCMTFILHKRSFLSKQNWLRKANLFLVFLHSQ
jgi:hypothetical protein